VDRDDEEIIRQVGGKVKRYGFYAGVGLVALMVLSGSYFSVGPNEAGAVTRMGELITPTPLGPGPHFKLPFVDTAHVIATSIQKFPIPQHGEGNGDADNPDTIKTKTIDNQFAYFRLNMTYNVQDPFTVLFKVGDIGAQGMADKLEPYVQSRLLAAVGQINALQITDQQKMLENNILKDIHDDVLRIFGVNIGDIQITSIGYDRSFEDNIQKMVQTRNQQVSAENLKRVKELEAEQAVAVATGEANSAIAAAEGKKQSVIKQAEANAEQIKLQADADAYATQARATADAEAKKKVGDAEAGVIQTKVSAAGGADKYAAILQAEATKNWTGSVPQYSFGGGSAPVTPLMMIPNGK